MSQIFKLKIMLKEGCWLFILMLFVNILYAGDIDSSAKMRISISITSNERISNFPDSVSLRVMHLPNELMPDPEDVFVTHPKENMNWVIQPQGPVSISIEYGALNNSFRYAVFELGDEIVIKLKNGGLSFFGKGAEKLNLSNEIDEVIKNTQKPTNSGIYITNTIDDYLEYNKYLHKLWSSIEPIIESYKGKISAYSYDYAKAIVLNQFEYYRDYKFSNLYVKYKSKGSISGITSKKLCDIYDSTFFSRSSKWVRIQPFFFVGENAYSGFVKNQLLRKYNFPSSFLLENHLEEVIEEGKQAYIGLAQESFIYSTLTRLVIHEIGFSPETEVLLQKYYNELKYSAYKVGFKKFEREAGILYAHKQAPEFTLKDNKGKFYSKQSLLGKLILMNFCVDDCNKCDNIHHVLKDLRAELKSDTNFIILNFISENSKSNDSFIDEVYFIIKDSSLLKAYGIYGCTGLQLIAPDGKIVTNAVPDPLARKKEFAQLIRENLSEIEKKEWGLTHDGPYVMSENNEIKAWYVISNRVSERIINRSDVLKVHMDKPNSYFEVRLKNKIIVEPVIYEKPSKLLALSDIEGNFDSFRNLLEVSKVIDKNLNWTFGTGHLVLAGDMFDRGSQVTECLWLIYELEEKAKAAGGYVHFILGNHEIMNLSGDLRYVQKKYKDIAISIKRDYVKDIYGETSELGKWLRSKNIIEKIGDILFVHGGISEDVNNLSLPLERINEIARPYYDKEQLARKSSDTTLSLIYNTKLSPFWYRLYYLKDSMRIGIGSNYVDTTYKTSVKVIESVLQHFNVSRIVTGHTIYKIKETDFGHTISVHYNGKVINTDTPHAKGYSEALFVENNIYYRINKDGEIKALPEMQK